MALYFVYVCGGFKISSVQVEDLVLPDDLIRFADS
jgi:hypothetical protein